MEPTDQALMAILILTLINTGILLGFLVVRVIDEWHEARTPRPIHLTQNIYSDGEPPSDEAIRDWIRG